MSTLRVMTFTIRGAAYDDGANVWAKRAALNVATINRYAPDLIGFQELQSGNLDTYGEELRGYDHVLGPAYDGPDEYSFTAIFWNPSRLAPLDSGGFWLSPTPDQWSFGWDADCVRTATWLRLRCLDCGAELLHVNTHLDHVGERARVEGSRLILQKLPQLRTDAAPTILTGDFNCNPGSAAYRLFLDSGFVDTYVAAGHGDAGASNTFHRFQGRGFSPRLEIGPARIDWILTLDGSRRIETTSCVVARDQEPPVYPSDHYPVLAELMLVA